MPFLNDLIGIHDLTVNGGAALPRRSTLNIVGTGVSAVDNPVAGTTDLTLPTSTGGVTITPPALTASTNNYGPANAATASVWRISSTGAVDLTGIDAGSSPRPVLINIGSYTITLKHESASSTAANRFVGPGAADYALVAGGTVEIALDTVSQRWRVVL